MGKVVMNDIYQKILEKYETFSGQQKKVADYILNNIEDVIYFPVSKFAINIEVSQATIVRFAQHLGYKGFNEFRDSLFEYYRKHLSHASRMKHSIEALEHGSSTFGQITKKEIVYLEKSISSIQESVFSQVVDALLQCRNVYIFGTGPNEHLGCYLNFKLRRLKINSILISSSGKEMLESMLLIEPEDAAVIYSFVKPSIDFKRLITILSDKKVPSILFTDIRIPSVVRLATYVLYAKRGQQGTFPSPIVPTAITNALILRIADKMKGKAIIALKELEELREKYYYNDKFKH